MKRDTLPLESVRWVTPQAMSAYAEALHFERVENPRIPSAIYREPGPPHRQLLVPLHERFDDYFDRVQETILRLAELDGRPVGEVLLHLLLGAADVLLVNDLSPGAVGGMPSFDRAARLVEGARRLLFSAAVGSLPAEDLIEHRATAVAEGFVARCRIGLQELGTGTVAVACPLESEGSANGISNHESTPLGRRVMERIVFALTQQRTFAHHPSVRFRVSWSPVRRPQEGLAEASFEFDRDALEVLEAAAIRLRSPAATQPAPATVPA